MERRNRCILYTFVFVWHSFQKFIYLGDTFFIVMEGETIVELQGRLLQLEKRIRPLEWDNSRNQINDYKKQELAKLKVEQANLLEELKSTKID